MSAVSIVLLNQKGGVGKTSTAHHLAGTLARMGKRVLLVDNDPQASLTQGFYGPVETRQIPAELTVAACYAAPTRLQPTSSGQRRSRVST